MSLRINLLHERELAFTEAVEVAVSIATHYQEDFLESRRRHAPNIREPVTPPPLAFEDTFALQHLERTPHRCRSRPEFRAKVLDGRQRATCRYLAGFPVLEQQALQAVAFAFMHGDGQFGLAAPKVAIAAFRINLPQGDQALVCPKNGIRGRARRGGDIAHRREPVPVLESRRFNPLAKIRDSHSEPP